MSKSIPVRRKVSPPRWAAWLLALLGLILLAGVLAWFSSVCLPCNFAVPFSLPVLPLWGSYLGVILLSAAILALGWFALQASERTPSMHRLPKWLAWLLIGAALLRLALGVVWYTNLPVFGHGTEPEMAGYVMADAHERDQTSWKLSQSIKPLWVAFQDNRKADQYGGMLFFSALIYRYLGGNSHLPLQMVVIVAAISSLAIVFTWAFARRTWDGRVAWLAAWGLALYPEVVLLGSSQMREALLIPLVAAAFYGLARMRQQRSWVSLAWLLGGVLLTLPISPPVTLLLIAALALLALSVRDDLLGRHVKMQPWAWLLVVLVIILALTGAYFALRQFAPPDIVNPLAVFDWWLRKSTDLQAHFSKSASGWIQKIFHSTPEWTHIPLLVVYGILRPFLPAALVVGSQAPIWPLITLWRAIGWTILLIMLFYALLRAWLKKDTDHFTRALTVIVWLIIVIASLRGGGDQDDNPRYRAIFASLQVSLAAWAWVGQRRQADPIFRRALIGMLFVLAWFIPWYLRRQFHLPWIIVDPFLTLALGLVSAAIYAVWDWARTKNRKKQI